MRGIFVGTRRNFPCGSGEGHGRINAEKATEVILLEQILKYIQQKYAPLSIILYGSYADGTNNLNSDFDALVITSDHEQFHDTSFVDGIPLDVFVYPSDFFDREYACEDFVQIHDGRILKDSNGIGNALLEKIQAYLRSRTVKSSSEIQASVDWCVKMLERTKRGDCEGMFRWHWVLIDSLEIFCDVMQHPYLGPKKALKWMEETQPKSFACYNKALQNLCTECLEAWVTHISNLNKANR